VLKGAGWKIQITDREEAEERFEEEFEDILHFSTLQDAEVSLTRLDRIAAAFSPAWRTRSGGARDGNWPGWASGARR